MALLPAFVLIMVMGTASCAGQRKDRDGTIDTTARPGALDAGAAAPDAADGTIAVPARVGDVEVRVRWPKVPRALLGPGAFAAARSCGEPLPRAVRVDAEFAVEGVFVLVEGPHTAPPTPPVPEARLLLAACDPSPAVTVAGIGDLLLYNQGAAREISVRFSPWTLPPARGEVRFKTKAAEGELLLMSLREPGVYGVTTATSPQPAIVVVPATPHAALTDERGIATLRDLPAGEHRVVAWLPGASDEAAQIASGAVTVTPGKTAELALQFGAP
ncbi:MAG: hypothetical protein IPL79_16770 [Myxococcales bacterium]|nr:hypothetical protein [Myxococcales bacterium]